MKALRVVILILVCPVIVTAQQSYIRPPGDFSSPADSSLFPSQSYEKIISYSFNRDMPIERQLDSIRIMLENQKELEESPEHLDDMVVLYKELEQSWEAQILVSGDFVNSAKQMAELTLQDIQLVSEILRIPVIYNKPLEACTPVFKDALIFLNEDGKIVDFLQFSFRCHIAENSKGLRIYLTYSQWKDLILFFREKLGHPIEDQLFSHIRPRNGGSKEHVRQIPDTNFVRVVSYSMNRQADSTHLTKTTALEGMEFTPIHIKAGERYIYQNGQWASTAQKMRELTSEEIDYLRSLITQQFQNKYFGTVTQYGCMPIYRDALVFFNEQDEVVGTLEICFGCGLLKSGDKSIDVNDDFCCERLKDFFKNELGHPIKR